MPSQLSALASAIKPSNLSSSLWFVSEDRYYQIIAIYIEYSPDTFGILLCTVVCIRLENTVHKLVFGRSGRTGLIVVINKVIAATLSGITTIGRPPIIEYIISQVNQFRIGSTGVAATTKTGSPAAMMCQ